MLGRPREQVLAELGDAVFLNPQGTTMAHEAWETADAYLSGPVRTKLAAAVAAAAPSELRGASPGEPMLRANS